MVYAGAVGLVALYQRFDAWRLGGACPVPMQKPWTYSAIAAAIVALLITFWLDYKKKHAEG